jgi:hypothetical protein
MSNSANWSGHTEWMKCLGLLQKSHQIPGPEKAYESGAASDQETIILTWESQFIKINYQNHLRNSTL